MNNSPDNPMFAALFEIMSHVAGGNVDSLCVVARKDGQWIGYAHSPERSYQDMIAAAMSATQKAEARNAAPPADDVTT